MLRSLVGSEMCIRDRYIAFTYIVFLDWDGKSCLDNLVLAQWRELMHGYGCLLYTSDAADDLLCVDLGGRRILKKKKNDYHFTLTIYHAKSSHCYFRTDDCQLPPP